MNTEPYGTTIFCDDIRHETNGKITLVGCYTAEMNFSGPPPGLLPSFSALVNIRIPKSVHFETIKVRVLKEESSESTEIFGAEVKIPSEEREKALKGGDAESTEEKILSMIFPLQWSSLPINASGFIKVRARLDDGGEIRLGALKVNFPTDSEEKVDQKSEF